MFRSLGLAAMFMATSTLGWADDGKGDARVTNEIADQNQFALDLYARLSTRPGNLFLSPFSISTALAMTYAGARTDTAHQMAETLHFSFPPEQLPTGLKTLFRRINGEGESRPYQLSVANAIWLEEDEHLLPAFLEFLEANYGSSLKRLDFKATQEAVTKINAWVEEQTGGRIKDLLKPAQLSPAPSLVLTNAIYFKGSWANPFLKADTKDEDFLNGAGNKVRVAMMHRTGRLNYFDGGTFTALELPYKRNAVSSLILLPKKADGLAELEPLTAKVSTLRLTPHQVEVSLPSFKLTGEFELKDVLSALGMPIAFSNRADFSGITGDRTLFISAVVHKAFIDVNEEGTEATAATAVIMPRGAVITPLNRVTFRADHPFVFLIRENQTGSILFVGRVTNPGG